jgi:tetratricopeptide (TPR) repeat protein
MRRLLLISIFLPAVLLAETNTLLVLPFFNLSEKTDLAWIGESISETLRDAALGEGLLVLDRDAQRESYRRLSIRQSAHLTKASVIKVGQALDASRILYGEYEFHTVIGSLAGSRGTLRIAVRLMDLKRWTPDQEWTEMGPLENLAAMENRLAWQALSELAPAKKISEEEYRARRPALRVDAMESYIRGLQASTDDQKIRFFTRAARLDDNFCPPRFQLGQLYFSRKEYRGAADWLAQIKSESPHYYHANFLLGLCRYHNTDYAGAEKAFRLVAEAVPLNEVFNNLGAAEVRRDPAQALEDFRKALAGDASDPAYHFNVGYALWKKGEFDAAASSFRAVLERSPDDPDAAAMLERCLKQIGPHRGDSRTENIERIKDTYEETAFRQLRAELEPATKAK